MDNGKSLQYFKNAEQLPPIYSLKDVVSYEFMEDDEDGLEVTSQWNQLKVLLRRGWIKMKRDEVKLTLTHKINHRTDFLFRNSTQKYCIR